MVIKNHYGTFTLSNYSSKWEFNGIAIADRDSGTIFIGVRNPCGVLKKYTDGTKHFIPEATLRADDYVYSNNYNK